MIDPRRLIAETIIPQGKRRRDWSSFWWWVFSFVVIAAAGLVGWGLR